MKKVAIFFFLFLIAGMGVYAQVGINSDNSAADPSAMLDVKSINKGLLIPQVALTATNIAAPVSSPAASLLIWNTATAGTSPNTVTPGFYYWNGAAWTRLVVGAAGSGTANYISKWSSDGTLGSSLLFDNGSGVGIGTITPAATAVLDLTSTTKGFLPPRMTTVQRNVIVSPAPGLIVFNTTIAKLQFFDGSYWINIDGTLNIGDAYQGGIIFYIDGTGQHGLISAPTDHSTLLPWGCQGTAIGGTSTEIGTGQTNTTAIVNGCSTVGIAARICDNLILNGYDDWFLPSKDELNQMYVQRAIIGGFTNSYYWSSSEYNSNSSHMQLFNDGSQGNNVKNFGLFVRAIRAF